MASIEIGAEAGHHFHGQADMQVAFHVRRGDEHGYMVKRKRLVNRAAYEYDPRMGWETDVWFEWVPQIPVIDGGSDGE